jgi:hypothetical protein
MRQRELESVPIFGLADIRIPVSLWKALETSARRQGMTVDAVVAHVIDGLGGLSERDVHGLAEPRREKVNPICNWNVSPDRKTTCERFSFMTKLSCATVLRRVLYGLLITREIASNGAKLERTQMHFDFAQDCGNNESAPSPTTSDIGERLFLRTR